MPIEPEPKPKKSVWDRINDARVMRMRDRMREDLLKENNLNLRHLLPDPELSARFNSALSSSGWKKSSPTPSVQLVLLHAAKHPTTGDCDTVAISTND
jgi:hypothetical protein